MQQDERLTVSALDIVQTDSADLYKAALWRIVLFGFAGPHLNDDCRTRQKGRGRKPGATIGAASWPVSA
jgi:hypothetical protein